MIEEKKRNTTNNLDERNGMKEADTDILTQEEDPTVQLVGLKDIDDPFNERHDYSSSPCLLLRAILILPLTLIRVILLTGIILIFSGLLLLVIRGEGYSRLRGWKKRLFEFVYYCGNRTCLFIIGVYWLKIVEIKESTLASYQKIVRSRHVATVKKKEMDSQDKNHNFSTYKLDPDLYSKYDIDPAAIVVSNHVCPFDPFLIAYLFDNPVTFVAKAEVKQSILAITAKMMEVLYVEKNNQEKLIHDMYERIREYYEHLSARNKKKGDTEQIVNEQEEEDEQRPPPLVIFPEGTTTSGYQMLKFHTGAFRFGAPVSPLVIRLPYKWFNMGWTSTIPSWKYFLFHYSQLYIPVTVIKFPKYIPNEQERDDPIYYAENVRRVMVHGSNEACPDLPRMTLRDRLFSRYYVPEDKKLQTKLKKE
jgi:1-acyl-sn-glycerol-3-phosphate acyltransferase